MFAKLKMKPTASKRKLMFRFLGGVAAIGIAGIVGILFLTFTALDDSCMNQEISRTEIKGTKYSVVTFQRSCGATTGFSTQASIIKTEEKLRNQGGNIFVADDDQGAAPPGPGGGPELKVKVLSPQLIELSHHPNARIFQAETAHLGINIRYSIIAEANQGGVRMPHNTAAPHTP